MTDAAPLEVAAINGAVITWGVVGELVDRLVILQRLAVARGLSVDPRTIEIRSQLARLLDHAGTRVNASTRVDLDELPHAETGLVDTATAARMLGIPTDTVRWHCREGQFANVAIKRGRGWWLPVADVEAYARRHDN